MEPIEKIDNNLKKEKNRLWSSDLDNTVEESILSPENTFQLKLISSNGTVLPRSEYVPLFQKGYDSKTMTDCIKASLKSYGLSPVEGKYFLVEKQNELEINDKYVIAIMDALELGSKYPFIADFFQDAYKPEVISSKCIKEGQPINLPLTSSVSLWSELKEYFERQNINIKILIPYTINSYTWAIGQFQIIKKFNVYQLFFTIDDLRDIITNHRHDSLHLDEVFKANIKKLDANAQFAQSKFNFISSNKLLHHEDISSSSVIAVEILLHRAVDRYFEETQFKGAINLRYRHVNNVTSTFSDENDPNRKKFLEKHTISTNEPPQVNNINGNIELKYNEENGLKISLTQYTHFKRCQTPDVKHANEMAAFHAAKTGNTLLLQALLGIESNEDEVLIHKQLSKEMGSLYEDYGVYNFTFKVLTNQIAAIKKYIDIPKDIRSLSNLKIELELIIKKSAQETARAIVQLWLSERPWIYFSGKKVDLIDKNKMLEEFNEKLLKVNFDLPNDFDKWQYQLSSLLSRMESQRLIAERSVNIIKEIHIYNVNWQWSMLDNKIKTAADDHMNNLIKINQTSNINLPNGCIHNLQDIFEYLYTARVSANARDGQNNTLLHIAFKHGHMEIVKLLLARGARIDALNDQGQTPAQYANKDENILWILFAKANGAIENESLFLKEVNKFIIDYEKHLSEELKLKQTCFLGLFLDGSLLEERQIKLTELKNLLNNSRQDGDDSKLFNFIDNALEEYDDNEEDYQGIFGTSRFYWGISELHDNAIENIDDYFYIRLPSNIRTGVIKLKQLSIANINKSRAVKLSSDDCMTAERELLAEKAENAKLIAVRDHLHAQLKQEKEGRKQDKCEFERKLQESQVQLREELDNKLGIFMAIMQNNGLLDNLPANLNAQLTPSRIAASQGVFGRTLNKGVIADKMASPVSRKSQSTNVKSI